MSISEPSGRWCDRLQALAGTENMPEKTSRRHSFLRVGGTSRSYMVEDMVTSRTAGVVVLLLVAAVVAKN